MSCNAWNDGWVAALYDELEEPERRRLEAHLEQCEACREELDALRTSSRLLREAAPAVPAVPRIVVLRSRQGWRAAWAFAGGVAAAAAILAGSLYVIGGLAPRQVTPVLDGAPATAQAVPPEAERFLEELVALRQRLAELERASSAIPATRENTMSRSDLQQELRAFLDRYEAQRAADLNYLLQTVAASEQRIDRNSQALTYLALRENPWVSEH